MAIVLCCLTIIGQPYAAFAAGEVTVGGKKINAQHGKTVIVPIEIENNPGIMGFKLSVEYDVNALSSPSVVRGSLTENGNFNDSIGVTPDGSFDIVWSDVEDREGDGTSARSAALAEQPDR